MAAVVVAVAYFVLVPVGSIIGYQLGMNYHKYKRFVYLLQLLQLFPLPFTIPFLTVSPSLSRH